MDESVPNLAIFLAATFAAALVTGLVGFAFGLVAAAAEPATDVVPAARGGSKLMRRLDSAAAKVNPFLTVIAIGFATITFTSLSVLAIKDALPPIMRVSCPAPASVSFNDDGRVEQQVKDRCREWCPG